MREGSCSGLSQHRAVESGAEEGSPRGARKECVDVTHPVVGGYHARRRGWSLIYASACYEEVCPASPDGCGHASVDDAKGSIVDDRIGGRWARQTSGLVLRLATPSATLPS